MTDFAVCQASIRHLPTAGRFLLTGSANPLTARKIRDALTGRMETIPLWPLAQNEIHGANRNFVDALFAAKPPRVAGAVVGRKAFADLREISDARKLHEIPRLLRLLASQAANILSYRAVAARLDLTHDTVREYIGLLQTVFLVHLLPAWRPGIGAREVQAPKAYLLDAGLLAHLLGADERRIETDDQVTGKVLENFVVTEVLKHAGWADIETSAYHYRQRDDEVDLLLESRAGEIVTIEVKATASVNRRDIRAMEKLRDKLGARFETGVVVCTCEQTMPLGDRLWAVPLSALWRN